MRRMPWSAIVAQLACLAAGAGLVAWALGADEAWMMRHVLPDWRAPYGELELTRQALRIGALLLAAALVLVVRPRLAAAVGRQGWGRTALAIAPVVFAAGLAVGAAELILRIVLAPIQARAVATHDPQRDPDPRLGWTYAPNHVDLGMIGGREVQYAFDPAGLRVPRPGDKVDPARPSILFVGESIMNGYGLRYGESIPADVARRTGLQAADLSVEGYSTDQAYLRLIQQWPRFKQPKAVVTLFLPAAVARTLDARRPGLTPGFAWRPARETWQLERIARSRFPWRTEAEVEAAIAVNRQVLQATARLAAARGARALVVTPVLAPEPVAETRLRARVLDGLGLEVLVVPIDRHGRLPGNRHPDARGAAALADAVADRLLALEAQEVADGDRGHVRSSPSGAGRGGAAQNVVP